MGVRNKPRFHRFLFILTLFCLNKGHISVGSGFERLLMQLLQLFPKPHNHMYLPDISAPISESSPEITPSASNT